MANKSDGKVVISTELDNSGIEKDGKELTDELRSQIMKLAHEYKKQGLNMSEAMKKAYAEMGCAAKAASTKMSSGAKKASTSVSSLAGTSGNLSNIIGKLGVVIATAFSVRAITNFAKEAIQLGSDLQEVQNVVDVTFTTMNKQLNEFAQNAAETAGLSETMAKRYAGTFGAMAKSFKFTEAEAYEMSTSLTQLAGDVASFYNISQDLAYTKLKSVFSGETEALKYLGVVMTQTALDEFALQKGMKKTTSQMSEQEKVALRYEFVMEQLSAASGDFVRTQDSWANQTRILSLQFDQLKATLGQGLINALTPLVEFLNGVISKLQEAAEAFRAFTEELFGDAGDSSSGGKLEQGQENAEKLENNIKAAKKALAGFDEINRLSSTEVVDTSIGGSETSSNSNGTSNKNLEESADLSSEMADSWKEIAKSAKSFYYEFLGKVDVKNVENYNAALDNLTSGWENLLSLYSGWDVDVTGIVADIVNASLLVQGGVYKSMGGILDFIAELNRHSIESGEGLNLFTGINAIFEDEDVWDSLGEMFSGYGMAMTDIMPSWILDGMGMTREQWADLFLPVTEEYTNLFRGLSLEAAEALEEYKVLYSDLERKARELSWSDAVITEEDAAEVKKMTDDIYKKITKNNEKARKAAEDSIHSLLEQGLFGEDEQEAQKKAKEALDKLNKTYDDQQALVEKNNNRINEILTAAKNEKRDLTAAENKEIQDLLQESNTETVAIITQGANDSEDVYRTLEDNRGKISKQMLSEAIKFAHEEYKTKVQAANDTYDATIANADKLYHELGLIDEEEYKRIKKAAEEKRKKQVTEAETARDRLIQTAQESADGVANAVDPETGEILSNWEILWNDMYGSVKKKWQEIKTTVKDAINDIIDFFNTPMNNINNWASQWGGKSILGIEIPQFSVPTIPKLASGAVLPANKPFLAMVGDQRHGTNVEAPLSTIQEAVAMVMADYEASNLAGHEATVELLQQILGAVLGIEVGDATIGQAANRYNRQLAITTGGLQ